MTIRNNCVHRSCEVRQMYIEGSISNNSHYKVTVYRCFDCNHVWEDRTELEPDEGNE